MQTKAYLYLACAFAGFAQFACAQLPIQFDENTYPTNPENSYGAFTFNDFSAAGAVTDGPTSLILDVQDSDGSNGVFGGMGVDFGSPGTPLVPHDFDPATAQWIMRVKILPNNQATAIRTMYVDVDDGAQTTGDEHHFEFDLTTVPVDGAFHDLVKPASEVLFSQGAFNLDPGNGINDPGLRQIQIQSVFGSTGRLNVEIDFVQIVAVPEPTALAMAGTGAWFFLMRRVRSARKQ